MIGWHKSCYASNVWKCALYSDCKILIGTEIMKLYTEPIDPSDYGIVVENVSFHYCQCGTPAGNGSCGSSAMTDLCVDSEYFASASWIGGSTFVVVAAVTLSMLVS